jgi:hypothetical protein
MSNVSASTSKRPTLTKVLLGIGIALIVLLIGYLFTMIFGNVSGTEFAPHSFKTREYHLVRIPLINIQVWPVQRVDEKSALVEHLFVGAKILTEAKKGDPEFDLVQELAGSRIIRGDAQYLQKYLVDKSAVEWLEWTRDHVDLAKVFWPEVQKVANRRMYAAIPEMFHIASQHDSPDALKKALHARVAAHYALIGQAEFEQGEIGPAIVLLEEAKTYAPQDQEIDKLLIEAKSKAEKRPQKG